MLKFTLLRRFKMKIKKTVRMRIVRPFYSPIVEERIREEKAIKEDGDISGKKEFWRKLKTDFPDIVTWNELGLVLRHLQSEITRVYNRAASAIYSIIISLRDDSDKQKLALLSYGNIGRRLERTY